MEDLSRRLALPNLVPERSYSAAQLVAEGALSEADLHDLSEWLRGDRNLRFTYLLEPWDAYRKQAEEMLATLDQFPADRSRVRRIVRLLEAGSPVHPVFVEAGDPHSFVIEGRHRLIAFFQLGLPAVPVLRVEKSGQ